MARQKKEAEALAAKHAAEEASEKVKKAQRDAEIDELRHLHAKEKVVKAKEHSKKVHEHAARKLRENAQAAIHEANKKNKAVNPPVVATPSIAQK